MSMRYTFIQRLSTGSIWRAGHTVYGLCAAHNHATEPDVPMTEREHRRSRQYARAIRGRMKALGYQYGLDYKELTNGMYWPIKGPNFGQIPE